MDSEQLSKLSDLPLEQQFEVAWFQKQVAAISEAEAKTYLLELFELFLHQRNACEAVVRQCKDLLKQNESAINRQKSMLDAILAEKLHGGK